jgi:hypothetical protein
MATPVPIAAKKPITILLDAIATKKATKEDKSKVPSIPIFTIPVRSHMIPTIAARARGIAKVTAIENTEVVIFAD